MLAPWQLSHPLVMPLWLNCPPAKVVMLPLAPLRGIRVDGMALVWQLSHAAVVGTCTGLNPDRVLGTMPAKVPVTTLAPWQLAQPLVTPLWLNAELLNLAPVLTGNIRLLLAPTWQPSQPSLPIPMWLLGVETMEKLALGMAKLAAAEPWHWAQLVLVDGALAWMFSIVGITEKSMLV
jgi:hypothetical protein